MAIAQKSLELDQDQDQKLLVAVRQSAATMDTGNWQGKLQDAMDLVLSGAVVGYAVQSGRHTYQVDPQSGCTCKDAQHRSRYCKHFVAVELRMRTLRRMGADMAEYKDTLHLTADDEPQQGPAPAADAAEQKARFFDADAAATPWQEQLAHTMAKAVAALPEDRADTLDAALRLVWGAPAQVSAERATIYDSEGTEHEVEAHCTCEGEEQLCMHRLAYGLAKRAMAAMPAPTDGQQSRQNDHGLHLQMPAHYTVKIQGREHVSYAGLLWLANRRRGGINSMQAALVSVTSELALATATVTFEDGTAWTEAADATPQNCSKNVSPHFARMALTRAKARALRDALGVGTAAAEEL